MPKNINHFQLRKGLDLLHPLLGDLESFGVVDLLVMTIHQLQWVCFRQASIGGTKDRWIQVWENGEVKIYDVEFKLMDTWIFVKKDFFSGFVFFYE